MSPPSDYVVFSEDENGNTVDVHFDLQKRPDAVRFFRDTIYDGYSSVALYLCTYNDSGQCTERKTVHKWPIAAPKKRKRQVRYEDV